MKKLIAFSFVLFFLFPAPPSLIANQDWPMWLRDSRGAPLETERQLQDPGIRPENRIWISEDYIPPARASDGRRAATNLDRPGSGGHASPIFANGIIYHYHYRPSGTVFDADVLNRRLKMSPEEAAREAENFPRRGNLVFGHHRWLVEATDILTAIDARTGKTIWQKELGNQGLNYNLFNKSGGGPSPAYHQGKVFVLGTGGQVWAVEADSGEIAWRGHIGMRARQNQQYRQRAVETGQAPRFRSDLLSGFVAADGVAIVSDHLFHRVSQAGETDYHYNVLSGYVAFDAASGDVLWEQSDLGFSAYPVLWENGGEHFLLTDHRFQVSLRNLRTGEALWEADFGHRHRFAPTVNKEYALINRSVSQEDGSQLSGFRISREGLEPLWSWDREENYSGNPLIMGSYGYVVVGNEVRCFEMETGEILATASIGNVSGSGDNPLLLTYGGWLITVSRKDGLGWAFINPDPQEMAASVRFFPHELERGYDCSIMPAIGFGHFFVRTETNIEAYRLDP